MTKQRRLIGLTGGIATGKSTVSDYLADKYDIPVLDADIFAKEAVKTGSEILNRIFQRYGDRINLPDGSLNRSALGDIIFNDSSEKQWLENQIHPYVRDRFTSELKKITAETVILSIPLLFEANLTHLVTEIWVVFCDETIQLQRLQKRNNLSLKQAQTRIKNQLSLTQKIALADVAIDNNTDLVSLYQQCDHYII
ncbi:MAG: dephospho-CoA kinase [Xenococcaceae cyanobacterium MO_167.B52]|nr:dephospho-CoA kinase [Xenococcaceae cyanobacterium MO_167.B52]